MIKKPLVLAEKICIERSGVSVLHDISFQIDHDESVALLGANGSGKSSLLHAIVGILPLADGTVELCAGHDSQSGIAIVPQFAPQTSLVPLTVFELVASGLTNRRSIFGYSKSQRNQIMTALQKVGLAEKSKQRYSNLSGGQLRRALIARALVSNAELLLLDEPLAGLDQASIRQVVAILRELRNSGHSMIVVSHELADLEDFFTRVIELADRKISYDGPPLSRHRTQVHHHETDSKDAILGLLT